MRYRCDYLIRLYVLTLLVSCSASCSSTSESSSGAGMEENGGPHIVLKDVTEESGLGEFVADNGARGEKYYAEQMGSGGGFFDYNGDGWLDIVLMGGGNWENIPDEIPYGLKLYRNNGDGTFVDVTEGSGLEDFNLYTIGVQAADYDNDGDQDLVVTTLTWNTLFRNDDGIFTEVGEEAGISNQSVWSSSAIFIDTDKDRYLDLLIGNYADWTTENDKWCPEGGLEKLYCIPADYEGIPSRYYHNNGDGTFTDRSEEAGFSDAIGKALGATEWDINRDTWSDLFVSNDGEGDLVYINNHDGTFEERGVISGFAFSEHGEARSGMGIDAGVIDSTGEASIFIGHFAEETIGVFQHIGNSIFKDRGSMSKVAMSSLLTLTFGIVLVDIDLDTDLDLFCGNGHVYEDRLEGQDKITFRQQSQLFLNRGDGIFDEYKKGNDALAQWMIVRAVSQADYDRDGDLDLLLTENNGPAHLWRNDLQGGHFLRVGVEGTVSNRDGIGTHLEVVVNGKRLHRRIRTGSSYLAINDRVETFGLGDATSVDSLIVFWPTGRIDRFSDIDINQELHLVEGTGTYELVPMSIAENSGMEALSGQ